MGAMFKKWPQNQDDLCIGSVRRSNFLASCFVFVFSISLLSMSLNFCSEIIMLIHERV